MGLEPTLKKGNDGSSLTVLLNAKPGERNFLAGAVPGDQRGDAIFVL
jgi:hypothetical protein